MYRWKYRLREGGALAVLCLFCQSAAIAQTCSTKGQELLGYVVAMEGSGTISGNPIPPLELQTASLTSPKGREVCTGDTIKVGDDGLVSIRLDAVDSELLLEAGSEFVLGNPNASPLNSEVKTGLNYCKALFNEVGCLSSLGF